MSTIVVYATDKDGEGDVLEVGRYQSPYEIRIPVGHFAPDVVLTFEQDVDELEAAHRKRKGWPEPQEDE